MFSSKCPNIQITGYFQQYCVQHLSFTYELAVRSCPKMAIFCACIYHTGTSAAYIQKRHLTETLQYSTVVYSAES